MSSYSIVNVLVKTCFLYHMFSVFRVIWLYHFVVLPNYLFIILYFCHYIILAFFCFYFKNALLCILMKINKLNQTKTCLPCCSMLDVAVVDVDAPGMLNVWQWCM